MKKERINRLISKMQASGLNQVIITDPVAIYYFIEKEIDSGERLLALFIHKNGDIKLVLNELFPVNDLGLKIVWYNDLQDGVKILSNLIKNDEIIGIDKNWRAGFLLRLQEILPEKIYKNSSSIIDEIRKIKDEEEKDLMRKSSLINDKVIQTIIPYANKGLSEIELANKVKEIYKENGITKLSFEPTVAYGKCAADPHHECTDTKGKTGDCVLFDIGGMYKHYASDMTRTIFLDEVSDRHREIYEVVKEANLRAIQAAKPGNKMSDVDKAARDYIESKGLGKYFTHRTGHSIGLETHEHGDVSAANDSIIEVGQCFSIEPGVYIAEENIGVRIEDLVLINEDGAELLNKVSKDLFILEN